MREKLLMAAACHMIRFFLALTENRGVERSQNAPAPGTLGTRAQALQGILASLQIWRFRQRPPEVGNGFFPAA
jgi:hypothetical protein